MKISNYARKSAKAALVKYREFPNVDGVAIIPNTNPHRRASWQIELFSNKEGSPSTAVLIFLKKEAVQ